MLESLNVLWYNFSSTFQSQLQVDVVFVPAITSLSHCFTVTCIWWFSHHPSTRNDLLTPHIGQRLSVPWPAPRSCGSGPQSFHSYSCWWPLLYKCSKWTPPIIFHPNWISNNKCLIKGTARKIIVYRYNKKYQFTITFNKTHSDKYVITTPKKYLTGI